MSRVGGTAFWRNQRGAVAAMYALALPALVAVAGVGFDYARLAGMDSELQNASDQAALAGATQLDHLAGAVSRATSAAQGGLVANITLLANDGGTRNVDLVNVTFYASKSDAEACNGNEIDPAAADADAQASFVCVTAATRTANYTLTPIVGAFWGSLNAKAVAGVGTAICKTPPLMMCNPDEPLTNTDPALDFDLDSKIGYGLRLVGDGSYAPGNFGFLQTGYGSGASALLRAIGYNTPPGDCIAQTGVDTQTGVDASVMDGFNTRFDINANGNSCPGGDANCSPSIDVKKDLVRGNQCGITGQNAWQENPSSTSDFTSGFGTKAYKPTTDAAYPTTITPQIMGFPRDICHAWSADGDCGGVSGRRLGDGVWDIDAYMRANHPSLTTGGVYDTSNNAAILAASGGSLPAGRSYPTRYEVYRWEIADYANRLGTHTGASSKVAYDKPVSGMCLATPNSPYGIVPGGDTVDRRRISIAVLNCHALGINGSENDLPVTKWMDAFLVEPSYSRTKCTQGGTGCTNVKYSDKTDLYVEIIGEAKSGGSDENTGQVVRRDVPYLIK